MKNQKLLLFIIITLIIGVMIFLQDRSATETTVEEDVQAVQTVQEKIPMKVETQPEMIPEEVAKTNQLAEELSQKMKALPKVSDLKDLTDEEVHHTPMMVKEGGILIGRLHEAAQVNPKRREETLKFFKSCAENDELLPAIRALCWKRTTSQIVEWKIFLPISDAKVSEEIKALATKIP